MGATTTRRVRTSAKANAGGGPGHVDPSGGVALSDVAAAAPRAGAISGEATGPDPRARGEAYQCQGAHCVGAEGHAARKNTCWTKGAISSAERKSSTTTTLEPSFASKPDRCSKSNEWYSPRRTRRLTASICSLQRGLHNCNLQHFCHERRVQAVEADQQDAKSATAVAEPTGMMPPTRLCVLLLLLGAAAATSKKQRSREQAALSLRSGTMGVECKDLLRSGCSGCVRAHAPPHFLASGCSWCYTQSGTKKCTSNPDR